VIALTIVAVYVVGFLITFRRAVPTWMYRLDKSAEEFLYQETRASWRKDMRNSYLFSAFAFSAFWLFTVPAILFWKALAASVDTRTPSEITAQERKELERLRSLAREYKLPMGDAE
jgi:hypothetical protein